MRPIYIVRLHCILMISCVTGYIIVCFLFCLGMVPVMKSTITENHNSERFCFDIDPFVSPCGCDVGYATCVENPCQTTSCPSYPEARCRIDFCGECKARWYVLGVEKDCYEERGMYTLALLLDLHECSGFV